MKKTKEDYVISAVNYTFLTLFSLICILPCLYVLSVSLTSDAAYATYGARLIPKEFSLNAYVVILKRGLVIVRAYGVSLFITIVGTLLHLLVIGLFAYPLSYKNLPGRKVFLGYILFSMLFGGGMIPSYIVISKWLGMANSLAALILPGAFSAWNMILMKNYFQSIPMELQEAAEIDGANEIRVFFMIIIPLSKPIIATLALFKAVGVWNDWFGPLMFINDENKYPIMLILKNLLSSGLNSGSSLGSGQNELFPTEMLKMATTVLVVVPILAIYPFLQKYFVHGLMMGSVKG